MSSTESIATPALPTSPTTAWVVAVVAPVGCEVEGDRHAGLPGFEVLAVEGVRLFGGREAGVLADRPRPVRVHRRPDTAHERLEAREVADGLEAFEICGRIEGLDGDSLWRLPGEASRGRRRAPWPRARANCPCRPHSEGTRRPEMLSSPSTNPSRGGWGRDEPAGAQRGRQRRPDDQPFGWRRRGATRHPSALAVRAGSSWPGRSSWLGPRPIVRRWADASPSRWGNRRGEVVCSQQEHRPGV